MASTVQSRLQFFSSLSGSQSSLNNRTPPYNSHSSLHASQRSLSRSLDTLPAQAVEQADSGKFMPVRDRIARYGVTPNKQQGPLADIKGRFKGASMEELPGPAESAGKTRLTASRAHPYPTSGNASSRHASEVDLRKDEVVEKQERHSEVQKEQEQGTDESTPVNLANRLAAYQAAATSPAAATPVANSPVKPEGQSKQQQAASSNRSASNSSPPQQAKFGVNNKCAACSKTGKLCHPIYSLL
ncbi:hypothetical protein SpCBS45565_g01812 [Spizellomyces sp. 'palustris']|nr:hypothetical protein SpCBS45565_g01812 [Spizellomyces sp. 'palustris']